LAVSSILTDNEIKGEEQEKIRDLFILSNNTNVYVLGYSLADLWRNVSGFSFTVTLPGARLPDAKSCVLNG